MPSWRRSPERTARIKQTWNLSRTKQIQGQERPAGNFLRNIPAGARRQQATLDATRRYAILDEDGEGDCASSHILNARIDQRRGGARLSIQEPTARLVMAPRIKMRVSPVQSPGIMKTAEPFARSAGAQPCRTISAVGPAARRLEPRRSAGSREFANAKNVTLAFGHRDHPARIE